MSAAKSVAKVIYLKHLPYGTTLDEVSSWFPIKSVDYVSWSSRRPNHCFVGFRHLKDAFDAVESDTVFANGVRAMFAYKLRGYDKDASIFVECIPYHWTIQHVYHEFKDFGTVMSINMKWLKINDSANAIVEFRDFQSAESAVYHLWYNPDLMVDFVIGSSKQSFRRDAEGYIQVWTDGCCVYSGRRGIRAGIGICFGLNHPWNTAKRVRGPQTGSVAEFEAVTEAILLAKDAGIRKLKVHTDSEFVVNCMTRWYPSWRRNGWRTSRGPVVNRYQIEDLLGAMEGIQVCLKLVPAHRGIPENDEADRLASIAAHG